jgi:hypothetical protein
MYSGGGSSKAQRVAGAKRLRKRFLFLSFCLGLVVAVLSGLWSLYYYVYLPTLTSDLDEGDGVGEGVVEVEAPRTSVLRGTPHKHAVTPLGEGPPPTFLAVVTTAYSEHNAERREREYALGLEYVFYTFDRVYALVSSPTPWAFIESFPFTRLPTYFTSRYAQKSAQESDGLRAMVKGLEGAGLSGDDIVFKVSGRYQIVRSDFIQEVRDNPNFDVWAKPFGAWHLDGSGRHVVEPGGKKIFTFFWAMRWRYFRDLYTYIPLDKLETYDGNKGWLGYDIESYAMDYIKENGLRLFNSTCLHVLTNIDNRGFLVYF